jgi:hypothetical protein
MKNIGEILSYTEYFLSLASKIEDLQQQYPDYNIEELAGKDPSPNHKYLPWMLYQLEQGADEAQMLSALNFFYKKIDLFKNKDIFQYKNVKDLVNTIKSVVTPTARKAANGVKLFEDDEVVMYRVPNQKTASQLAGRDTEWCITGGNFFNVYSAMNAVFYFIIRKFPLGDAFDKIAFTVFRDIKVTR